MHAMRSDANERPSSTPSNNAAADPRCSQLACFAITWLSLKRYSPYTSCVVLLNFQRKQAIAIDGRSNIFLKLLNHLL